MDGLDWKFDTFEFVGLIAPGGVLVVAATVLYPQLSHGGDSVVSISLAILSAYVIGHIVAAIGKIIERYFSQLGLRTFDTIPFHEWKRRRYISSKQIPLLEEHLRECFGSTLNESDVGERRIIAKQMYLTVVSANGANRLETFAGLSSLSRGMIVSFFFVACLCVVAGKYIPAVISLGVVGLMLFRLKSFNDSYSRELLQQFCFAVTR